MKITTKRETNQQLQLMAYARRTWGRYQTMSRFEKKKFLDQLEQDFGRNRKSLIRLVYRLNKDRVVPNQPLKLQKGLMPDFINRRVSAGIAYNF